MSTILFTWELGQGFGHLAVYRDLVAALSERGERVIFAARDVERTDAILGDLLATIVQAPIHLQQQAVVAEASSYPQILLNCGFASVEGLLARCRAWRQLYQACNPDLVIYDHSPTAMAAFRGSAARGAISGTGFVVPPLGPLPDLKQPPGADRAAANSHEIRVHEVVNQAFETLGSAPLDALSDLWDVDDRFLLSVAELDPYGRAPSEFLGSYPAPVVGQAPDWPAGDVPKVFGYLHGFRSLPDLLALLRGMPICAFLVCPELPADIAAQFENEHLRIARSPVDLGDLAGQCAVVITNGTHGATLTALLSGVPVLVMPDHLERLLTGRCVEALGVGRVVRGLNAREAKAALNALLDDQSYAERARGFAARYAHCSPKELTRTLLSRIDRILH
jgi:hypothetical protein